MSESFSVKEPAKGDANRHVGIVLLNHVGSNRRQDSGRDAQDLADRFNVMALATDRPTSYGLPRDYRMARTLKVQPVKAMLSLASRLDKAIEDLGLDRVIIAGRSAGGLGALELAMTEGISSTSLVYAAEPVGCDAMSVQAGQQRFKDYNEWQKELQARDKAQAKISGKLELVHPYDDARELPKLQQLSRIASMGTMFFNDKYYNKEHWNQALVPGYLSRLALDMQVPTHVDFAEHSLVLPEDRFGFMNDLYEIVSEDESTLSVDIRPGTTHASFDLRDFTSQRIQTVASIKTDITLPVAA